MLTIGLDWLPPFYASRAGWALLRFSLFFEGELGAMSCGGREGKGGEEGGV